jgi:hypothetical protein
MAGRRRENAEQLFSRYDSYSVRENQRRQMATAIEATDPDIIRTSDSEELAKQFADRFSIDVPALIEGAISMTVDKAQIDVTGDYRFGAFGPGPTFVAGIRASYYVPFSGERDMFHCSASTRYYSMRPVELGKDELTFTYERSDQDVAATQGRV